MSYHDEWKRELRVCTEEYYDRYFFLTIPEGDIPQSKIVDILQLVDKPNELRTQLRLLIRRDIIALVLDRMRDSIDQINHDYAQGIMAVLFDIGDEMSKKVSPLQFIGPEVYAVRIIHDFMSRQTDDIARIELFRGALVNSDGVYLPLRIVDDDDENGERKRSLLNTFEDDETYRAAKELILTRIRQAATTDRLHENPHLAYILNKWRVWGDHEEVAEWVKRLIETPHGLLEFLKSMTFGGIGGPVGGTHRQYWAMDIRVIEKYVTPDVIEEKLAGINTGELAEKERIAVEQFRQAIERKKKGLSDDFQ